jgi:hypothetical protein
MQGIRRDLRKNGPYYLVLITDNNNNKKCVKIEYFYVI